MWPGGWLCGGDFAEAGDDSGIDLGGVDEIDVLADHVGGPVPPGDFLEGGGGCLVEAHLDLSGGNAGDHGVWLDILGDDGPRTDYRAVSDGDAAEDHGIGGDPDIVADGAGWHVVETLLELRVVFMREVAGFEHVEAPQRTCGDMVQIMVSTSDGNIPRHRTKAADFGGANGCVDTCV